LSEKRDKKEQIYEKNVKNACEIVEEGKTNGFDS